MKVLLNSDIAKLVLAYLKDEDLIGAYKKFCRSSRYLTEEYELIKKGYEPVNCGRTSLIDILREYFEIKTLIEEEYEEVGDQSSNLTLKEKLVSILDKTSNENSQSNSEFLIPNTSLTRKRSRRVSLVSTTSNDTINDTPTPKRHRSSLNYTLLTTKDHKSKNDESIQLHNDFCNETDSNPRNEVNDSSIDNNIVHSCLDDMTILKEKILENPEFQNKLVENINKVLKHSTEKNLNVGNSSSMDALLESELNDAIKNILNATEQDPIFEEILDDVVQTCASIASPGKTVVEKQITDKDKENEVPSNSEINNQTDIPIITITDSPERDQNETYNNEHQISSKTTEIISSEVISTSILPQQQIILPNSPFFNPSNMIILNPTSSLPLVNLTQSKNFNLPFLMTPTINLQERHVNIPVIVQTNPEETVNINNETKSPVRRSKRKVTKKKLPKNKENIVNEEIIVVNEIQTEIPIESNVVNEENQREEITEIISNPTNFEIVEESVNDFQEKNSTPQEALTVPSYLKVKSNSTPRRRSHVRVLDFTTPSRMEETSKTPRTIERSINIDNNKVKSKFSTNFKTIPESTTNDTNLSITGPSETWDKIHGFNTVIGSEKKNNSTITNTPKIKKNAQKCVKVLSRSASEENDEEEQISESQEKIPNKNQTPNEIQFESDKKLTPMDQWKQLRSIGSKDWDQYLRFISSQAETNSNVTSTIKKCNPKKNLHKRTLIKKTVKQNKLISLLKRKPIKKPIKKTKVIKTRGFKINLTPSKKIKRNIGRKKKLATKAIRKEKSKEDVLNEKEVIVDIVTKKENSINIDDTLELETEENFGDTTIGEIGLEIEKHITSNTEQVENISILNNIENESNNITTEVTTDVVSTDINEKNSNEVIQEIMLPPDSNKPIENHELPECSNIGLLLETPFKVDPSILHPITPRFIAQATQIEDTPITKILKSLNKHLSSELPQLDVATPSFPITPGCSITPLKGNEGGTPTSNNLYNRPTDYSSSSSYYRPDESDIDKVEALINADRKSKTDLDNENQENNTNKIVVPCPGVIERVKSFTETVDETIVPHYTFTEELPKNEDDSFSSNASICSKSSKSSLSSSSTSSSSSLFDSLSDSENDEDYIPNIVKTENKIIDEEGEIRYPIRTWITPKKISPEKNDDEEVEEEELIKNQSEISNTLSEYALSQRRELEAKRLRIKEKIENTEKITKPFKSIRKVINSKRTNTYPGLKNCKTIDAMKSTKTPRKNPTPKKFIPPKSSTTIDNKQSNETTDDTNSLSSINSFKDTLLAQGFSKSDVKFMNNSFVKLYDFRSPYRNNKSETINNTKKNKELSGNSDTSCNDDIELKKSENLNSGESSNVIKSNETSENVEECSTTNNTHNNEIDNDDNEDDFNDCEIKTSDECINFIYDPLNPSVIENQQNIDLSKHIMRVHFENKSFTLKINENINIFENEPKGKNIKVPLKSVKITEPHKSSMKKITNNSKTNEKKSTSLTKDTLKNDKIKVKFTNKKVESKVKKISSRNTKLNKNKIKETSEENDTNISNTKVVKPIIHIKPKVTKHTKLIETSKNKVTTPKTESKTLKTIEEKSKVVIESDAKTKKLDINAVLAHLHGTDDST